MLWSVITFSFLYSMVLAVENGCSVNLDRVGGEFPPLLLQDSKFIFPTSRNSKGHRTINIGEGEKLELFCHGSILNQNETLLNVRGLPKTIRSVELTCKSGKFMAGSKKVNVEMATCTRRQEPAMRRTQEECSPKGADGRNYRLSDLVLVQIGWQIRDNFQEQIRLCHDEKEFATIWTQHVVRGASIELRDIDASRPSFRTDNSNLNRFYPWATDTLMNRLYSKTMQKNTVTDQLGLKSINSEPFIDTSSSGTNYFAKGHLSPDAAFVYNILQDATYYFMNVAPQFQSFNNGNWKALEGNTRDIASKLRRDVIVYTGTYDVLEYKDKKGKKEEIYLYSKEGKQYIPAPKYYWKVLIDPETNTSAAFIGLNDPHATKAPRKLCKSVCSEMDWVDWSVEELDGGYMYCCTLESARESIPSMPEFKSEGLLQLPKEPVIPNTCLTGDCACTCVQAEQYSCSCKCNGGENVPVQTAQK